MPTKQATKRRYETRDEDKVWTEEERAAMQASARERKAAVEAQPGRGARRGPAGRPAKHRQDAAADRAMAERIHAIVTEAAPALVPKTLLRDAGVRGKDGKVICFFKPKSKFKVRYSTFGFQPDASLDDGEMWPTEFAVIELTPAVEKRIVELVKKAVR